MNKRVSNQQLIASVLTHTSQKEVAEELHLSQRQVCMRLKDRDIQQELSEARRSVLNATATVLVSASQNALQTLLELLESDSEKIRLQASSKILQLSSDFITMTDIIQRIEHLEEAERE